MSTNDGLTFFKSSYSGDRAECVEVAQVSGFDNRGAAIRDSKHPTARHLPFPALEWTGFLSAALTR